MRRALDARAQTAVGEHRGHDPVGELTELAHRLLCLAERFVEQSAHVITRSVQRLSRQLERDQREDEALLCAVVQIADDSPALFVGRRGDARAGGGERIARLQVGDRGREQLGELGQPRPEVGRKAARLQ